MLSSSSLPAFLLLPGSSFAEEKESATRDALFQELCLVIVMLSFCKSVSCFSGVGAAVAPGDQSFFRDQMRCDPGMGRGPRRPTLVLAASPLLHLAWAFAVLEVKQCLRGRFTRKIGIPSLVTELGAFSKNGCTVSLFCLLVPSYEVPVVRIRSLFST